MPRFEIQQLENRVLLSAAAPTSSQAEPLLIQPVIIANVAPAPAAVIAIDDDPSDSLNATVRFTLVSRLNAGTLKDTLTPLVDNAAVFDQALLDYMRAQTTGRFFFGPGNLADRVSFISASGLEGSAVARADEIMLHLFPQQGDAAVYDVQVDDTIDFDKTTYSSNAEFLPYLNRFEYWMNLGQAYLYTGDADYVREIVNELSSFALQAPTANPATWATTGGVSWDLLSASLRVEHWIWTYQMVLDSSAWTKEANTLFISRLWEHGDFMSRATAYEPSTNRSLFHAKSEMMLAQVFPEFLGAASWETQGRSRMFTAMDAQLYNDGSHVEQSPNYTGLVIEDVLEAKWLDEINGDLYTWPDAYNTKINNAIESYRQMLSPDASQPAIGDTYRNVSVTMFTKAALIQDLITVKTSAVNDPDAATYPGPPYTQTALKVDDANQFAIDDQIHLQDRIEVMLVTGVNLGTNTLTVQRGYGTETRHWTDNQVIYNVGNQTVARARVRDVYLFGGATMEPFIDIPATPPLGERGKVKALTDSGNYIARSHGNDKNANQVIFDAGPTGGLHGHYDLLNFELYGGGRPLISDPGAYLYGDGDDRAYVVSTKAHNTISIQGGPSHAALEGAGNPGIVIDQYSATGSSMHITAHHHGYQYRPGRPVVGRSMWYDLDGTIVIVDWAEGNAEHTYVQSYNIQTEGDALNNVGGVVDNSSFKTNYASGSNVKVTALPRPDQTVARGQPTFVTNDSSGNIKPYQDEAYRFTVTQTGAFVYFVTLISAYTGTTPPDTTATLLTTNAGPGDTIQVELTKGGVAQTITFTAPQLERPASNLGRTSGGPNSIQYDAAGRLHVAYYDRAEKVLKYTVQETSGLWSIIETIDNSHMAGEYISLALDSNGLPGVAYYDGNKGDLKYAKYLNGAWDVVTVDGVQNVGLYPSLVFSRNNGPIISYYHHTKKDLRMAVSQVGGFSIDTVDSAGDVGRWSSMVMDPNRTDASKMAIAYEDTSNGDTKYAIQGSTAAFNLALVDNMIQAGGYNSLAFYDSGEAGTKRYRASISYYDAGAADLRYAYHDGNVTWASQRIAFDRNQGLYTSLFYDNDGRANIFYFDRTNLQAKRAKKLGKLWTGYTLVTGGREMSVAKKATGALAYTTLDESLPRLDVQYPGS